MNITSRGDKRGARSTGSGLRASLTARSQVGCIMSTSAFKALVIVYTVNIRTLARMQKYTSSGGVSFIGDSKPWLCLIVESNEGTGKDYRIRNRLEKKAHVAEASKAGLLTASSYSCPSRRSITILEVVLSNNPTSGLLFLLFRARTEVLVPGLERR